MKFKFTLLFLSILSLSALSQEEKKHVNYDTDSRWFIGINLGGTYHTSDIESNAKAGFSLMLGRSFFMQPGNFFSLDLRLRYLNLQFEGVDEFKSVDVTPHPYLNGQSSSVDYFNDGAVMNFSGDHHRGALELAVNFNRLREKTGVNFYLFGGAGFNNMQNSGNYLFSTDGSTDSLINYSGNYEDYKEKFDEDFETALPSTDASVGALSDDDRQWAFMPSAGIGLGYQLGPKFSIGFEHETTFTLGDLFDGNRWVGNQGQNDIYHFTSLWFKFHIGGNNNSSSSTPEATPSNVDDYDAPSSTQNSVSNPAVKFTNPYNSPYQTQNKDFLIRAQVENIDNRSKITFKQNGNVNTNFVYNPSNGKFKSDVTLKPGNNVFEIKVVNNTGHDYASAIINWEQQELAPPVVSFSHPGSSPHVKSSSVCSVSGKVLNVQAKSNVTVTLNGNNVSSFNFNANNGSFNKSLSLIEGTNFVTVKGVNNAGSDQKTVRIIYNKKSDPEPPEVNFINPSYNPYSTNQQDVVTLASVVNVDEKNDISFTINGQQTSNFTYNNANGEMQAQVSLIKGANILTVAAQNNLGSDQASTTIIRKTQQEELPSVYFTQPSSDPTTLFSSNTNLEAQVIGVQSKNDISLKINGSGTNNFNYNSSSKKLSFSVNLQVGANLFEILASNSAGSASASTTIIYKKVNDYKPPKVTITSPLANPYSTQSSQQSIHAEALNVDAKQNITVKTNGTVTSNFIFNASGHTVDLVMQLNAGNNTIEIIGSNQYGQSSDSKTIVYKKPESPRPPQVNIIAPTFSPFSTTNSNTTVKAQLTNISTKQQITVSVNGSTLAPNQFIWNGTGKKVTINRSLVLGNNIFNISASNNDGTANDVTTILYKKREEPCDAPEISIQSPNSNLSTTAQVNTTASIDHVQSASEVKFKLNGNSVSNFNFNNGILNKNITLQQGSNVIQFEAENDCGTDQSSHIITYKPVNEPCESPIIQNIYPQTAQLTTSQSSINVKAGVQNAGQQNISMTVNGQSKSFNFSGASHILKKQVNLQTGINEIKIQAETECGVSFYTWNVRREKCHEPVIRLIHPQDGEVSKNATVMIKAVIENAAKQDILLYVNGQSVNFVFDNNSNGLSSKQSLKLDNNVIKIIASNDCGNISEAITIQYKKPEVSKPPRVIIKKPSNNPHSTSHQNAQIKAIIKNVTSGNDVSFKLNGSNMSNFNFNANTGSFTNNISLQDGQNVFTITAINSDGQDSKTQVINYKKPVVVKQPRVVFQKPNASPYDVSAKYYRVKGYVKNVDNSAQVQVQVNNQNQANFGANISNDRVYFNFQLAFSTTKSRYDITIIGSNSAGVDQASVQLNYDLGSNPMGGNNDDDSNDDDNDANEGSNSGNPRTIRSGGNRGGSPEEKEEEEKEEKGSKIRRGGQIQQKENKEQKEEKSGTKRKSGGLRRGIGGGGSE